MEDGHNIRHAEEVDYEGKSMNASQSSLSHHGSRSTSSDSHHHSHRHKYRKPMPLYKKVLLFLLLLTITAMVIFCAFLITDTNKVEKDLNIMKQTEIKNVEEPSQVFKEQSIEEYNNITSGKDAPQW